MGSDIVLVKLDSARIALREAKTIPEAKRFVDIGVTAETWARQQKLGEEITGYAHAFTVDALAHLGRMLRETAERGERVTRETARSSSKKGLDAPTLADLGLDKKTSALAQKIASLRPEQLRAVREASTSIATSLRNPHVSHNSGENEWYTPPAILERARKAMGGIDCDPASSERANKNVKACLYYTSVPVDSGLVKPWKGRVWLNPPYSNPLCAQFCGAVVRKFRSKEIDQACVLVNNATETEWFAGLHVASAAVCFLDGRVKYLDWTGVPANTPLQGQAVLYLGSRLSAFASAFRDAGRVTVLHE